MITIPDLKIHPAKLKLVMDQWKQYGIMMVMATIILVMGMANQKYDIGYDAAADIDGMGYVSVIVSLHTTSNI